MSTIISDKKTVVDQNGNVIKQTTAEKTIRKDQEPDYIKLYTRIWFDFKQFPAKYRELFLQLAIRMSYCNASDPSNSQIIDVMGHTKKEIMAACGWKTVDPMTKGLKSLCDCGAIARIERGTYQINPEFAGRGTWRYDPKLNRGGIKDLITTLRFADGTIDTLITYADDIPDVEE